MKGKLEARLVVNDENVIFVAGDISEEGITWPGNHPNLQVHVKEIKTYLTKSQQEFRNFFELKRKFTSLPSLAYDLDKYAQNQALKNYKINLEIK